MRALPAWASLMVTSLRAIQVKLTLHSSVSMALVLKSVPVSLSICKASLADLGIQIPNLCVVCQYLLLTLPRMCWQCHCTFGTHQEKAGSWSTLLAMAYLATDGVRLLKVL